MSSLSFFPHIFSNSKEGIIWVGLIFANEANGNVDKNGYGTLERSEQTEYILQTEETDGALLGAKEAYYNYEIKEDNVDSKYVELIGYKTRNYRLS